MSQYSIVRQGIILFLFLLFVAGCSGEGGTEPSSDSLGSSQELAKNFADSLIKGDMTKAEGMLTSASKSRQRLSDAYAEACKDYSKPSSVETDEGELPASVEEAADYGLPSDIPLDKMKAWLVCEMTNEKGSCFDMWVLVVEEGSELKIGYYEMSYPD